MAAVGDRAHAQVEAGRAQARLRGGKLVDEGATDVAGADEAQRQRLRRQEEAGVGGAQGAGGVLLGHRHRDVALGGALGDRPDVDLGARQGGEQGGGDAGVPAMPSPTAASTAMPGSAPTAAIAPLASSAAKVSRRARTAMSASPARTAQQIECSELPWEIITTDTSASCRAPNTRSAVPGTPIMPAPSTSTRARPVTVAMPFTGGPPQGPASMRVPGRSGAKVLRMMIGMPRANAGARVRGWMTLAPK